MEVDSAHAAIERHTRKRDVYVPSQYFEGLPARFTILYLDHSFFKNYSKVIGPTSIRPGKKAGDPTVTNLRALQYRPGGEILYKVDFDHEWAPLPVRQRVSTEPPPPLYTSVLPLEGTK